MRTKFQRISPFLWFDQQAEEAAEFYVSIFPNSSIGKITRYTDAGPGPKGSAMTGPSFKFTEAVSFVVNCTTQEEVDRYWEKLSAGGKEVQCGWLQDKFGLSWQVVPTVLIEMLQGGDPERSQRVMKAMFQMKKLDIAGLERAFQQ
jgi:predicted 3-demethylubiquinone-9 3-methyltransferase (glyoxalase superfamily)